MGFLFFNYRKQIDFYLKKKHSILWSKDIEIKPSDFQGKINWKSNANEWFYHELYLKATSVKDAKAIALFDKNKSWIKDTTRFNELIKKQKLRFDLFEIYARKYNVEIEKVKLKENSSFSDLEKIGNNIYAKLLKVEDSIIHSTNGLSKKQSYKHWRKIIDHKLTENQ
jgi:hypothetical protein